jgi:hypothetical protein
MARARPPPAGKLPRPPPARGARAGRRVPRGQRCTRSTTPTSCAAWWRCTAARTRAGTPTARPRALALRTDRRVGAASRRCACLSLLRPSLALAREAAGHLTLSRRHGLATAADALPARRSLAPSAAADACAGAGLVGAPRAALGGCACPDREPGGPGPLSPPAVSPDAARLRGRPAGAGAGEGPAAAGRGAAAGDSQESDRGPGRDAQLRGGREPHGGGSPGAAARSGSQPGSGGSQPGGSQGARGGAASPAPKRTPQRGRARPPPPPAQPPAAPAAHATVMEVRTASPCAAQACSAGLGRACLSAGPLRAGLRSAGRSPLDARLTAGAVAPSDASACGGACARPSGACAMRSRPRRGHITLTLTA